MANNWINYILSFFALILLQVIVLNHISFLNYATPFLYIYLIIKLPIGINRNITLVLAFFMGLIIDLFSNTLGQNAAASVFAAFLCQPVQHLFFPREDFEQVIPGYSSLGISFFYYTIVIVLIHNTFLISLSSFSYLDFPTIFLRIVSSTVLTCLLIFGFEGLFVRKKKHA